MLLCHVMQLPIQGCGEGKASLAAGLVLYPAERSVNVWSLAADHSLGSLAGHRQPVSVVACSTDGQLAAAGCNDGSIWVWNVPQQVHRSTLTSASGSEVWALSQLGSSGLASAGDGRSIDVWDLESGTRLLPTGFTGHESAVLDLAATLHGNSLLSCSADHTIR